MAEPVRSGSDARARIVVVAARLLGEGGPAAVTTRGVAEAAGVQAPAIYRLFGDKDGLLDAVAEHVLATFVETKAALVDAATGVDVDPLDDLRAGWQAQMEFGLANPAVFRLMSDPDRAVRSPAAQAGRRILGSRVHRIAVSGRLRVSEERAVGLLQAAGIGAIQTLHATPPEDRDPGLAQAIYEAVLQQILADPPGRADGAPVATAVAFRAVVPTLDVLSEPERRLLVEWLDRVISAVEARS